MPSESFVIKYGTPLHTNILERLSVRYDESKRKMQNIHTRWQNAERTFAAYMPVREADALRELQREQGRPQYTTIAIPYSYSILMTAHTYWTSVFLSRDPIMQFQARHGEPKLNVQAIEALMDYQVRVGKMMVPLFLWLLDVGKYGHGFVTHYWDEEIVSVASIKEVPDLYMGVIPTGRTKKIKQTQQVKGYLGNRVVNVRPYHFYPDTRVPLQEFQRGEFCGHYFVQMMNDLVRGEQDGRYFNVKALLKKHGCSPQSAWNNAFQEFPEPDVNISAIDGIGGKEAPGTIHSVEMTVDLIPRAWKLGSSDRPEKWVFTTDSAMQVIYGARPLGAFHNRFPYEALSLEPEAYALVSRGIMEILKPMQDTMDWLINTHMYNVRKVLNDQIIVDPSRVMMKDVLDPLPGGIWRLTPGAYGTDTRTVASQLQVVDVTQQHIKDSALFAEMMQRVSGVTDQVMGLMQYGGRKTAQEIRTAAGFGMNRLKTQSEFFSASGWENLAQALLQTTQQYYDVDRKFRIAKDLMIPGAEAELMVTPESITGFYDYVPVDGSLPIDRQAQVTTWLGIMQQMASFPQVLFEYDLGGIFAWLGQLAGLKDMGQFRVRSKTIPDDMLLELLRSGKLVSLNDFKQQGGAGNSERYQAAGSPGGQGNVGEAPILSGMGEAG